MFVEVDFDTKTLNIQQEIAFFNDSNDSLSTIVLNDWNNAYSNVKSPLAKRFSDEFYRGFHLANEKEKGSTNNITIIDANKLFLGWERTEENPDVISVKLREKLGPKQKTTLYLTYVVKIPSDKFTKYGYDVNGGINLKTWYLSPARYENHGFIKYNNENLDDIANAVSDYDIELKVPKNMDVSSDLNSSEPIVKAHSSIYKLSGKNRINFDLFIEAKSSFYSFKNSLEVLTNLKEEKISGIQKAIIIDNIVCYVNELIGKYPFEKIVVSETDYERNPFYGLNQLPSFISPFSDEFTYEIKFLKTYLNAYLKNTMRIDNRKNSWINNGIQVYAMMKYIHENHPNSKMLGSASSFRLLRSYNLTNLDFNEQYSYFYMLMARKNLDQPLGSPKNTLIKFNEQIASKYHAGLSLRYLDNYLGENTVTNSIRQFYAKNQESQTSEKDFETLLKSNTEKNIDWFFNTIVNTRKIIDYKFSNVIKTKDSISFSIKNKTGVIVPVPIYGVKHGKIVLKKWLEPQSNDTIFTLERNNSDKIVINYNNEVPEYNLRNNWKSLKSFFPNNRPIKFVFMKDLEDPYYNQVLYVPTLTYNLYDGLSPGIRLHNKTILDKPFVFDVNPSYSTKTSTLSGSGYFVVNQNYRNSALYNVRYSLSSSYFHYAPDATYLSINPTVQLRIRENDFRDNHKQLILFRQVMINREKSAIVVDNSKENYSVFNTKYFNSNNELTKQFSFMTDLQLAGKFGKVAAEWSYRKLFENNHQIQLRFYAGSFLYNKTNSDFFSFALDRPTDYLFDYNYYGRSESSGFFSQQLIIAEGGFKSKLNTPFANQWISTLNAGYNIWNWVEVYGDLGVVKNKSQNAKLLFDSGIRLNLVPDYFEMYLPVYSSNGWEIGQNKYNEKIRFIITLSPKILINLFNRKWF
ncbi:aminopeptidase [Flavobacterium acetivorans]|uniref:aminopeptidase n=1 Tax=Flavobacterium acetivorans TaxID=2893883 RepID=UPI001E477369|nr:aminopeptidase [Flavobacterium sp. F-29]UFH36973.1 aminopeptidase [Flavobacterium sp. F-29]